MRRDNLVNLDRRRRPDRPHHLAGGPPAQAGLRRRERHRSQLQLDQRQPPHRRLQLHLQSLQPQQADHHLLRRRGSAAVLRQRAGGVRHLARRVPPAGV